MTPGDALRWAAVIAASSVVGVAAGCAGALLVGITRQALQMGPRGVFIR